MLTYRIICKKSEEKENYGIAACLDGAVVKSIPDISPDKEDIAKIVEMCNELEIELCHFEDIVEDYLTDFCI